MILTGRELPKINGSSGGFIALLVCLSVLIVVLCTAVFILLRDHSPSDEERAIRRQLSQRRREQTQTESSSYTYPSSTAPVSLARKVGGMFGIGATADEQKRPKKGGKSGKGWIQTGSDDESENEVQSRSISGLQKQGSVGEVYSIKLADRSTAREDGPIDPPFRPPQTPYSETDSTSSVPLYNPYTPSSTPPPLRTAVTRLQLADSPSPSSASSLALSSAARALSGSPESYAADSIDDIHPPGERHFSTNSGGSITTRTSHTGTKFIESL